EVLAELRMPKRVLHGRPQISDLAAAVVAGAAEWVDVDGLVLEQLRDTVGELNLAAGAAFRPLELVENSRRQDVTADDGERRRRLLRLRLLDDLLDALTSVGIGRDADDTVAPRLIARHGLDAQHAVAVLPKLVVHLLEARHVAVDQIICEMHEERLVADGGLRAKHGMAEA